MARRYRIVTDGKFYKVQMRPRRGFFWQDQFVYMRSLAYEGCYLASMDRAEEVLAEIRESWERQDRGWSVVKEVV